MKILSIDTSADETSVAVTDGLTVLSNILWSQISLHQDWGGIVPTVAQRAHEERIDFVIKKALGARSIGTSINAIAVTVGPGLGIALGVGIDRAKKLAIKNNLPLIAINHIEAHILSPLAKPKSKNLKFKIKNLKFPAYGLVISGGNTTLVLVEEIGKYTILAETRDDALGEALDKGGRMLGLGYPAGPIVEKFAKKGNPNAYPLPIPVVGREKEHFFSYSGLKTSLFRLVEKIKEEKGELTRQDIQDLCASFQNVAFKHLIRVVSQTIRDERSAISDLLIGGGVSQNIKVRRRLRKMCLELNITPRFPYSKKLCGDNAAMIGITAYFKAQRKEFISPDKIDRIPNLKIDQKIC